MKFCLHTVLNTRHVWELDDDMTLEKFFEKHAETFNSSNSLLFLCEFGHRVAYPHIVYFEPLDPNT